MDKPAPTEHPIHPLIAARWSSRAFDDRPVTEDDLASMLEAARWAPSSFNEQPWSFVVAHRHDAEEFETMLGCLVEGNQVWACRAALLILSVARLTFRRNDKPNRHALHDVGLATANLSLQATELGINVHQMAGFHADRARRAFEIPDGYEPVAIMALGYQGAIEVCPDGFRDAETAPRVRQRIGDFTFRKKITPSS